MPPIDKSESIKSLQKLCNLKDEDMQDYRLGDCKKYSERKDFEKIINSKFRASRDLYKSSSSIALREKRTMELSKKIPNFQKLFHTASKNTLSYEITDRPIEEYTLTPYSKCL